MKLWTIAAAALFALMMAMPGAARADVGNVHPQTLQPAIEQTALVPQPVTLAYYHRPYACGNRYFRRHHWWLCR